MNILLTGGCGYVGSVLANSLLDSGHSLRVFDTTWFGNHLSPRKNLEIIVGDMRELPSTLTNDIECIVHLANIANDPSVELNPALSWEVNVLGTQQLAELAIRSGVKQFIYASSGSVYGIKDEEQVTEDLTLVPISTYNKTKMVAERVALSYQNSMRVHCIRPATVCGCSPRMRLDVSVNMLTFQALENGRITVFGGDQTRPNIHVKDMVRVYEHFIEHPLLDNGSYNAGFENISILEIAERVCAKVDAEVEVSASNDPRSYRQNSDKLLATGFQPRYSVNDAMDDLITLYQSGGLEDLDEYYTVKWMKTLSLGSS